MGAFTDALLALTIDSQGVPARSLTGGQAGIVTTTVALAAALGAGLCEIRADVGRVHTADPRIVPGEGIVIHDDPADPTGPLGEESGEAVVGISHHLAVRITVTAPTTSPTASSPPSASCASSRGTTTRPTSPCGRPAGDPASCRSWWLRPPLICCDLRVLCAVAGSSIAQCGKRSIRLGVRA
ncbi:hypothetical protein [Streptomyces luteireticuli]|uniref:hypothetical protein n=1 Tax=Streptomyces luteireticuli TaxID=173858 RepID=UPI003556AB73